MSLSGQCTSIRPAPHCTDTAKTGESDPIRDHSNTGLYRALSPITQFEYTSVRSFSRLAFQLHRIVCKDRTALISSWGLSISRVIPRLISPPAQEPAFGYFSGAPRIVGECVTIAALGVDNSPGAADKNVGYCDRRTTHPAGRRKWLSPINRNRIY